MYSTTRLAADFVRLRHDMAPGQIANRPEESAPLPAIGIAPSTVHTMVVVRLGRTRFCGLPVLWNAGWPLYFTIATMTGLLIGIVANAPELEPGAFDPAALSGLTVAVRVLALRKAPATQQRTQSTA